MNIYQIAKKYVSHPETVRQGIHKAGGITGRRARKYFHSTGRERQLMSSFGVSYSDMIRMYYIQNRRCLWCLAILPNDPLDCVVDHIGGRKTSGDRKKVRGLCCASGHCNRIAGMIERGQFIESGLLVEFINHVKHVIKENEGVLL